MLSICSILRFNGNRVPTLSGRLGNLRVSIGAGSTPAVTDRQNGRGVSRETALRQVSSSSF